MAERQLHDQSHEESDNEGSQSRLQHVPGRERLLEGALQAARINSPLPPPRNPQQTDA
jgi:hypothetical protein